MWLDTRQGFGLLLFAFGARAGEFQTAWFVESMLTQVLVIFVIRTQGRCWKSRPHRVLAVTSLAALAAALCSSASTVTVNGLVRVTAPREASPAPGASGERAPSDRAPKLKR